MKRFAFLLPVVLCAACSVATISSPSPTATVSQQASAPATPELKTFSGSGFSFKYPSSWAVEKPEKATTLVAMNGPAGLVLAMYLNTADVTIQHIKEMEERNSGDATILFSEYLSVGGRDAYRLIQLGKLQKDPDVSGSAYVANPGGGNHHISWRYKKNSSDADQVDKALDAVIASWEWK